MKMVMVVVARDEAESVLEALVQASYTATFTESRGGMLREAQVTLFIAIEEGDLAEVLEIIEGSCHSHVTVESDQATGVVPPMGKTSRTKVGGAVVFVWDLEQFEIY